MLKAAIYILMTLALSLGLTLSCSDDKAKSSSGKTQDSNLIEPSEAEAVEAEAPGKISYTLNANNRLQIELQILNSKNELESLESVGARSFVSNGSQSYDFFEMGRGEVKAAALLRNDSARLSMAYIVNTSETMAIWNHDSEALVNEAYDEVYIFDHAPSFDLNGSFNVRLTNVQLLVAAESVGADITEFIERMRVALIEETQKKSALDLLESVKSSYRLRQASIN